MKKLLLSLSVVLVLSASIAWAGDYPRNQSLYVTMRDGVRIAVDVWLPEELDDTSTIPALMHATRYWRARQNVAEGYENDNRFVEAQSINAAGYALVLVDARGSGASFGTRPYEMSVTEAQDY